MNKTTFVYNNQEFTVEYDPSDSSGLGCITEIATLNHYVLNRFSGQKGKVFIDIGANLGIAAIIVAKLNPESTVYAFEPYKKTYNMLLNNIKLNNITNIQAYNIGVSKKGVESLTLNIFENMSGANSTYADTDKFSRHWKDNKNTDTVGCTSLDKFLEEHGIDEVYLLKIDCEGAEFDIIYDSEQFKQKKIKNLVGEFHDMYYNNVTAKSNDLLAYCKQNVSGLVKVSINTKRE